VIARALATDPRVLICDEAFSALDAPLRHRLQMLLRQLCAERDLTVMLITHDLRQVLQFADRAVLIDRGRVVEQGTPARLLHHPQSDLGRRLSRAAGFGDEPDGE
jgi:ABC-type methionine transport system ATPase subunit